MKPEEVGYTTDLDRLYGEALQRVLDGELFASFLKEWDHWLDDSSKTLTADDWERIEPLIADCRPDKPFQESMLETHKTAIVLLMPEKIVKVSMVAGKYHVPWGCAYIRMKEDGIIKY